MSDLLRKNIYTTKYLKTTPVLAIVLLLQQNDSKLIDFDNKEVKNKSYGYFMINKLRKLSKKEGFLTFAGFRFGV